MAIIKFEVAMNSNNNAHYRIDGHVKCTLFEWQHLALFTMTSGSFRKEEHANLYDNEMHAIGNE
jgi:hypothetical protein